MTTTNTQALGQEELKAMDIDDLMDLGFDDIQDAAEYKTPPKGYYALQVNKIEQRTVETKDGDAESFDFTIAVNRTIELEVEDATPVDEGTLFRISFMQGQGIQQMKKVFGPLAKEQNLNTLRELFEGLPQIEFNGVIGHRFGKDDRKKKENPFPTLSEVVAAQ